MELQIINPQQKLSYAVVWIELNTPTGNIIIQSGHAPMVVMLSPGKPLIFKLKTGKQESFIVRQGIAHITRNLTKIIMTEQA
jgi:F0F1-type ATP synthase epsilon subunit